MEQRIFLEIDLGVPTGATAAAFLPHGVEGYAPGFWNGGHLISHSAARPPRKPKRSTTPLGASLGDLLPADEAKPVMAGVNPVIHPSSNGPSAEAMDPRVTPGGDASRKPGDPFASRDLNVVRLLCDRVILTVTTSNARSGVHPSRADGDTISAVAGTPTVTNEGTGA